MELLQLQIRKSQKGQSLLWDFAFAFMLFVIIWVFISSSYNEKFNNFQKQGDVENMRLKSEYVLDYLVKSEGIPSNWEYLTVNDLNRLGLAITDRELSEPKLAALSNFSSNYEQLKATMNLEGYDFYLEFNGVDDMNAGLQPQSSANQTVAVRAVKYKGGVADISLKLYSLE